MKPDMSSEKTSLKQTILEKIERDDVCPRSRLFFFCRESIVWGTWLASVLFGSLAIAVTLFVMKHHQYALYEATHENWLTFIIEALPYIWFLLFILMTVVAVTNLKYTKHGYRYPVWKIMLSSLVISLAGGATLQLFSVGYSLDQVLGEKVSMYMSQDKTERKLWQMPMEGRLVGNMVLATSNPTTTVVFSDIQGERWVLTVTDLNEIDRALLSSQKTVRVLGTTTDPVSKQFYACGIFPWMFDADLKMSELSKERHEFVTKVYNHMVKAEERLALLKKDTEDMHDMGICAELGVVKRVEKRMY